ncbi:MAG: hypothetical protein EOM91_06115 [Sphingobacteriia bacterium]|nr:hypothetical protein [Sphingobacteriia bacterium]NCC39691.1 hypothetical protein [Gammaproteobacteria bacterium]
MDRFTRIYAILIALIIVAALLFWARSAWQPEVWELDSVLSTDAMLVSYPYRFRVVAFADGVATISTPRSFAVPAYRFLSLIHPNLANKADDDPAMIAAQQELIDHQKHAQGLILSQPNVRAVEWELDTQWLAARGILVGGTQ